MTGGRFASAVRARLERRPPGYSYSIGRILAIYSGLMVVVLMASLDQTIVATALPHIVSDLGGLTSYSWVFTAFLLCQTVSVPIYGKLGDIFGRRVLLLTAISIFLLGSVLCGAAHNMLELVIFRGLQGVGAGGLIPLMQATIGQIVPPRDRGRYQALISGTFGTAAILGPLVGGLIADNTSWRWIFYINVPVGAVGLVVIVLTMPKDTARREHSIDYLGSTLFAGGAGALMLALAWGGGAHAWSSLAVIGAFVVSVLMLAAFVAAERRAAEPIIPFDLLCQPTVATGSAAMFLGAICLFGTIAFVPLFVQGVIGTSATSSGVALTPFMLGTVCGAIISGQLVARTGRYRMNALVGPIVLAVGMVLLWHMNVNTSTVVVARNMVIGGLGLGLMNQVFVVAAQNSVPNGVLGTVTGLLQFSRAMGTAIGVTVFGTIITQRLPPRILAHGQVVHNLSVGDRATLASVFHPAFLVATTAAVLIFVVVFFGLKERPLRWTVGDAAAAEPGGRPVPGPNASDRSLLEMEP